MHKLQLTHRSIFKFREYDSTGSGFIRRSDMLSALSSLGCGQVPQVVLLSMIQLFETRVDGQVNYGNFVEYMLENGASKEVADFSKQLYKVAAGNSFNFDEAAARKTFDQIDYDRAGGFNLQRFTDYVTRSGVHVAKEAIVAVYVQMDPEGQGVLLSKFVAWLRQESIVLQSADSHYSNLSINELKRKANSFMTAVASSTEVSLELLLQSYLIYDHRKPDTGFLDAALFCRATGRAGFPFTEAELSKLSKEFGVADSISARVNYKR